MISKHRKTALAATVSSLVLCATGASADDLPVKQPDPEEHPKVERLIRNMLSWEEIHNVVAGEDETGMTLKLDDQKLHGTVYSGQYPFEFGTGSADTRYPYTRYDETGDLSDGTGLIHFEDYVEPGTDEDANAWVVENGGNTQCEDPADCPTKTMAYRVEIDVPEDVDPKFDPAGESDIYDGRQSFSCAGDCQQPPWEPVPTIVLGPMVNKVTSKEPGEVTIALETDERTTCRINVRDAGQFGGDKAGKVHEITIGDLRPDTHYSYQAFCRNPAGESVRSARYTFETAPQPGSDKSFTFAFASDSREGAVGEGAVMGLNKKTLKPIATDAHRRDADLFLFGGDLVNGYTSSVDDFSMQLKGWKQAMEGYWRSAPVYAAMGNHESLLNIYEGNAGWFGLGLDKWPYDTDSAEAVFAKEFYHPANGPEPADDRRPPYSENVYSFQYGSAKFIAFNNNYWFSNAPTEYGGNPEGYIMADQLSWIEQELQAAENDPSVKYIFLFAQEPVFPSGGHTEDAMWYNGNNNIKAYVKEDDDIVPANADGVVEARNRLWEAVSNSSKVAAVLTGDEHNYQRKLITSETPVGIPAQDDTDGDGKLEQASANPNFGHPTYAVVAGHAGAPFYAQEEVPWEDAIQVFTSRIGYLVFNVTPQGVSMTSYASRGDKVLDHVDNLMAVKNDS